MTKSNQIRTRIIFAGIALFCSAGLGQATTYYLNSAAGKDTNSGRSPQTPFRTLARADAIHLQAGDRVLLAAGQYFAGQLAWEGISGTATNPIVISSYPAAGAAGAPHR